MQSIMKKVNSQYLLFLVLFVASLALAAQRASTPAQAAPLTSRSLSLSSNVNSGTATATFTVTTAAAAGGFEFVFCTTPLPGATCAGPAGLATASLAAVTVTTPAGFTMGTVANAPACTLTGNAAPASANTVAAAGNTNYCAIRVHHPTTAATAGVTTITLNNLPNPTASGTYFVRIATYSGVNNTYTGFADNGTVAQSVQAATNVSFRVQEILQVCAGSTTITTNVAFGNGDTCNASGVTGYLTAVDLGVADPAVVRVTPVASGGTTQGNDRDGFVLLRTNANGGTTVRYRTLQDNSSGELKVTAAACNATPSTVTTDSCINSAAQTQTSSAVSTITAGTERFGMVVPLINRTGSTTTSITANTNYDGNGATGGTCNDVTGANCWTWQYDGTAATIAAGSGPIDDELVLLRFAATPSFTTPAALFQANMDIFAVATY